MGEIKIPFNKKYFCGILINREYNEKDLFEQLKNIFGDIEDISGSVDFSKYSRYYDKEMGAGLKRFFVFFKNLFPADMIAGFKLKSNALEKKLFRFNGDSGRKVNIDPGYIDLSKMVVASTKDATYRVYLHSGIYAQPMLRYYKESFIPFEWTYPDYKDTFFIEFFNQMRDKYKRQIK